MCHYRCSVTPVAASFQARSCGRLCPRNIQLVQHYALPQMQRGAGGACINRAGGVHCSDMRSSTHQPGVPAAR